ncbi:FkbM family methyltransferase [Ancylobacter mangrovi]|uniref:FkbM family methyltransferase n=1 Tax=Ancylobacter mangrovi TaxID=2972472 RepID=UPI0021633A64|nr:FkbM family methyltransferase [Ancylobacter mangrovi]MCS0501491.1 FkbM family methyltransferase [Ancylobacter mangrovi]
MQFLPLLVGQGETACDVGANHGLYTYWMLRLGAHVLAFEPNPAMGRVIRSRFGPALKDGRLTLFECAASDENRIAELHIPVGHSPMAAIDLNGSVSGARLVDELMVYCRRLDDCIEGDVAFIKIDVEGHEQNVLDGARRLIGASRPSLLIEAEERHRAGAVASVRATLEPMGYSGFYALADGLHPVETFDPARHQRPEALDGQGGSAREPYSYVNNLIFIARPNVMDRFQGWTPRRLLP